MTFLILLPLVVVFILVCFPLLLRWIFRRRNAALKKQLNGRKSIGIFHPYCNAGGGGERVLWCAVRAIQSKFKNHHIFIYTGDNVKPDDMILNAKKRFNVELHAQNIDFIYLKKRNLVEASMYPCFTLIGQSLGSVILGFEAIWKCVPDVYIDTMGYSFTYPVFRYLGGCEHIGCYVHYPTISTDMLTRVVSRFSTYNNHSIISRSKLLSQLKIVYYKLFAALYGLVGRCAHTTMVNSSWTENHINQIWKVPTQTNKVYPPCDVKEFLQLSVDSDPESIRIISVAQFRPEKDHPLMIRSFYKLIDLLSDEEKARVKLVFVGSCRNKEDYQRVEDYKRLCKHFNIDTYTEFYINVEFEELKRLLEESTIGLHSMWNEHFGISIVECMAAGLIMVAHKSGGPAMDIIFQRGKGLTTNTDIGFTSLMEAQLLTNRSLDISVKSKKDKKINSSNSESSTEDSEESMLIICINIIS
uniref:GDP-Man:Man(3)GlcNAc(2)-PP-Dol alpha-1,2-mannosyltransferase n=1 Tax=Evadne anonyx TaxID=141404 RepID=A0A9N6WQ51_9CRUS|nr:EOG090X07J8 [Evadne anonyx]